MTTEMHGMNWTQAERLVAKCKRSEQFHGPYYIVPTGDARDGQGRRRLRYVVTAWRNQPEPWMSQQQTLWSPDFEANL